VSAVSEVADLGVKIGGMEWATDVKNSRAKRRAERWKKGCVYIST
jgi:hypothetical protein